MSKKPKAPNIRLSSFDVEAILCALPLLDSVEADTPIQQERNAIAIASASSKLLSHSLGLDANEVRVIAASLTLARELLAGRMPEFEPFVDADHRVELQRYLFSINRLEPVFNDAIAPLL